MPPSRQPPDTGSIPTLLRGARATYAAAIGAALREAGFADVPRDGAFVLGAIAHGGTPMSEIITRLRISKQAAGQLVDTLVRRGYLVRSPDPDDRRRLTVRLTERGDAAAAVGLAARHHVDAALVAEVGTETVARLREALRALARSDLLIREGTGAP
jgi:DNA-binding MarR family transcriptional regulator